MNEGKCINDNVCECKKQFTGNICSERFQIKKSPILYIIISIIGYLFGIISLLLIPVVFHYKNHNVIKAGKLLSLFLILLLYLRKKKKKEKKNTNY